MRRVASAFGVFGVLIRNMWALYEDILLNVEPSSGTVAGYIPRCQGQEDRACLEEKSLRW